MMFNPSICHNREEQESFFFSLFIVSLHLQPKGTQYDF